MARSDPAVQENEVTAGFHAMLEELKINSRPHLTTLTILAGEYRQYASQIVSLIETRLHRVRRYRLPVMYLIDNIIKEFPEEYVPIFSANLVTFFAETFRNAKTDERTKLYELRTTWDGVFQAKVLYNLDVQIHQIDAGWPIRVKKNQNGVKRESENGNISSSDEFSTSGSERDEKVGLVSVANGRSGSEMISPPTPRSTSKHSSVHSSPRLTSADHVTHHMMQKQRIRPQSNSTSPVSVGEPGTASEPNRPHRYRSLDERVSSLEAESRQHSDISDASGDESKLEIVENVPAATSPVIKMERSMSISRFKGRFESPRSVARRGSGNSSTVSSPRHRESSVVVSLGKSAAERGIQVKAQSTTRAIQTGQFTREASSETIPVQTRDQATQRNRRKAKQRHFQQQWRGMHQHQATQAKPSTKNTSCQWQETDANKSGANIQRLAKGFEFRNVVTRFCANGSSRMADSILRRLHEQQKRSQFCDLTLNCEGGQFRVHKGVMASVSELIERESWMKDEVAVEVKEDVLQQLIDYAYTQMLGPFTRKSEVEELLSGITKLKIRSLDFVVSRIGEGLKLEKDYIGYAISGTELISAETVTAAMIGHSLPPIPPSSYGLADLEETGFNGGPLVPEMNSDEDVAELAAAALADETIKRDERSKTNRIHQSKGLDEERVKRMPHKKRLVAMAKERQSKELVESSSSSSTSSSESDSEGANERLKSRRIKRSFGKVSHSSPKSPAIVPKKRKAESSQRGKTSHVAKPSETPKRQRRKTNEGIAATPGSAKVERRGRPRKIAPVFPPVTDREKGTPAPPLGEKMNPTPKRDRNSRSNSPRVKKVSHLDTIQQILDDEKAEEVEKPAIGRRTPARTKTPPLTPTIEETKGKDGEPTEEIVDDRLRDTDPDNNKESDKENEKRKMRRRTVATTKPPEPKKDASKTPKRKSLGVIIPPAGPVCPYDEEVSAKLRLRDHEFAKATGFVMQVAFLQHVIDKKDDG